jgi:glycolate oxidase
MTDRLNSELPGTRILDELAGGVPELSIRADPDVLEAYRRDQAGLVEGGMPLAVVGPRSVVEIQHVLRIASQHRVPVVPRGAGSGLSGGANAVDGGLVMSLTGMNRIIDIDRRSLLAVVEPGVLNVDLSKAVAEVGLWYPPDPASAEFSTIGGNIATNAGGLCCVKYGVTRDFVLGLEVVLADGTLLRTGRKSVKGVAGYDLTALFVGSEGTLGVITQATLRLRPAPPPSATLVAFFVDLTAVGTAITEIASSVVPSVLELMDRATLTAVEEWKHLDLDVDAAAMVIARSDATGEQGANEIDRMATACTAAGASFVARSTDAMEADLLMSARRLALPALERQGNVVLDDVAVPIGRIPDLLRGIEGIASRHGVLVATFGHAGDGNMHPTIVFDGSDPDAVARARSAFADIVRAALALDGTITGEHGVGILKRPLLAAEIGDEGVRVHSMIKHALDPQGILNPGKVL